MSDQKIESQLNLLGNKTCRVAQPVKHPTLGFSLGHDLTVCGIEPRIGFCADSMEPAWDSLSLPLPLFHVCSLSQKKPQKQKQNKQQQKKTLAV